MALTPTAVQNRTVLQSLRDEGEPDSVDRLAKVLGRDASNLRKSIKALEGEGMIGRTRAADPASLALTPTGRAALLGIEVADGTAGINLNAVRLTHEQLRPNPLNPRDDAGEDEEGLRAMADTIEARDGPLQPLVVFPAGDDGTHTLWAGERRYLAIGILISEGRWAADHPIDCIIRDGDPRLAPLIAVIENGQRRNLSWLQEAGAFRDICEANGWSARRAAQESGRDPRTVQEMLKVMREARPEDIQALHEGEPGWTVERLRNSVKTPQERAEAEDAARESAADEPETLAMFPDLQGEAPLPSDSPPRAGGAGGEADRGGKPEAPPTTLAARTPTNREALALIELAHKTAAHPVMPDALGQCGAETHCFWTDSAAIALSQDMGMVRLVLHAGGAPVAFLTQKGIDWLWEWHEVTSFRTDQTALDQGVARQSAERARARLTDRLGEAALPEGAYRTPWLRPAPAEEADAPSEPASLAGRDGREATREGEAQEDQAPESDPFQAVLEDIRQFAAGMNDALSGKRAPSDAHPYLSASQVATLGRHLRTLLQRLEIQLPLKAESGSNAGGVMDRTGEELMTVDVYRENTDTRAEAIGLLSALSLNLLAGVATPIDGGDEDA